jgi:hypothetical protein
MIRQQDLRINEKADEPHAAEVTIESHTARCMTKRKDRRKRWVVKLIIAFVIILFFMPVFTFFAKEIKSRMETIMRDHCNCTIGLIGLGKINKMDLQKGDPINQTDEPIDREGSVKQPTPPRLSFRRDEGGQISVLFVFAIIALVFLIGLIYNTVRQTTRKIQMQNAADSAAIAGSVTVARGLNLMVMNNNTMADVLAVMITVRSLLQTSQVMRSVVIPGMIAAFSTNPFTAGLVPELTRELAAYTTLEGVLHGIDYALSTQSSGLGWQIMNGLDRLNQAIKTGFPPLSELQTVNLAKVNGADRAPYQWITYAEADVYNPTHWGMFTQDWRAKLVRAEILGDKADKLAEKLRLRGFINGDRSLSFVNTH